GAARGGDATALTRALKDIADIRLEDGMQDALFAAIAVALDALGAMPEDVAELRACALSVAETPMAAAPPPCDDAPQPAGAGKSAATIRINVEVLEQLMRSVSELVLIRN